VAPNTYEEAISRDGVALLWYQYHNHSRFNVSRYFAAVSDLPAPDQACADTSLLSVGSSYGQYLKITGDPGDMVTITVNGKDELWAKCYNDWLPSKPCRDKVSSDASL